jgi:phenylalanyl-tRNA synthetase beta chain
MKFSYNWLKKLFGMKKSSEQSEEFLAEKPQEAKVEEKLSQDLDKVVVGEVLEVKKHPNADRLRLAKVNVGTEILEIVCGAPNLEVGQKVMVATLGAKLPNGAEIKEANIRGVKSCGMICAEDELGLGSDHAGIMILDENTKIGMEFKEYIDLNK